MISRARRHVEPMLAADFAPTRQQHIVRYQWDQRVITQSFYARILWLQGHVDRAMRLADDMVEDARTAGHVISLVYGLAQAACLIAIYAGNLAAAGRYVRLIQELTVKHGLEAWSMWGRVLEGILLTKRGRSVDGADLLARELDGHPTVTFHMQANLFRAELAEGLAAAGQPERALAMLRAALRRAERSEEGWCLAELLRKEGELLLLTGASSASGDAERCFRQAVEVARRQGALAWSSGRRRAWPGCTMDRISPFRAWKPPSRTVATAARYAATSRATRSWSSHLIGIIRCGMASPAT